MWSNLAYSLQGPLAGEPKRRHPQHEGHRGGVPATYKISGDDCRGVSRQSVFIRCSHL